MPVFVDLCNNSHNITIETKFYPAAYVDIVCFPILLALCTIGNLLNLIVISSDHERNRSVIASRATKVFLLAMAVSDLCLMWVQLPSYLADYSFNITWADRSARAMGLKHFYWAQQWLSAAFMQCSDWVLIALSIDRLRSFNYFTKMFHESSIRGAADSIRAGSSLSEEGESLAKKPSVSPSTGQRSFSRRTAICISFALLIAALIYNAEYAAWFLYADLHPKVDRIQGEPKRPQWLLNWNYGQTVADVVLTVVKFTALGFINIHLIIILIRYEREVRSQRGSQLTQTVSKLHRRKRERNGTHVVIGCLVTYIVTHLPFMVLQCMRLASSSPACLLFIPWDAWVTARPPVRVFLFVNYSVNFLLYFALSQKFRDLLRQLPGKFHAWKRKSQLTDKWRARLAINGTSQKKSLATACSQSTDSRVTYLSDSIM